VPITYLGRGMSKDVYKTSRRSTRRLGRTEFRILKVARDTNHAENSDAAATWSQPCLAGYVPECLFLASGVPLWMYDSKTQDMRVSATRVSVLVETCSGPDVAVACEAMIKAGNWEEALQTWGGGLRCWLQWQVEVGGGRLSAQLKTVRVLRDVHARNVCSFI
jgi:hypothetical protein